MKINFSKVGLISRKDIKKVFAEAINALGQPDNVEVSVSFVSEKTIQNANQTFRNIDSVTDVLSFPVIANDKSVIDVSKFKADVNPQTGNLMLGDILICTARAKQQAKSFGHSIQRELCFLALHGLLHLFGYDHVESSDEKEMAEIEDNILKRVGIVRENK